MRIQSRQAAHVTPPLRQLSWSYTRGSEKQQCILALDTARRVYELRVRLDGTRETIRVERFSYVSGALERQCQYEEQLLAAGFSLDCFEAVSLVN